MYKFRPGKPANSLGLVNTSLRDIPTTSLSNDIPPAPYKLFSEAHVISLKKQAKRLKKKSTDLHQHQALDIVAEQQGFSSWKTLTRQNGSDYINQQIHDHSVTMLFDVKDFESFRKAASQEDWWQTMASYAQWLDRVLYKKHVEECKESGATPLDYDDYFEQGIYDYFPVVPSTMPQSEGDALAFLSKAMKFSHFSPVMVIYTGKMINLDNDVDSELSKKLQAAMGITIKLDFPDFARHF